MADDRVWIMVQLFNEFYGKTDRRYRIDAELASVIQEEEMAAQRLAALRDRRIELTREQNVLDQEILNLHEKVDKIKAGLPIEKEENDLVQGSHEQRRGGESS